MTQTLNVVQQQWIALLASVNLVMREMVLPVKVSIKLYCKIAICFNNHVKYNQQQGVDNLVPRPSPPRFYLAAVEKNRKITAAR